jgi:hypothetical protein
MKVCICSQARERRDFAEGDEEVENPSKDKISVSPLVRRTELSRFRIRLQ